MSPDAVRYYADLDYAGTPRYGSKKRKDPLSGAFRCAEEDSNLHPLSADQALNLVTRVSCPSGPRQIVVATSRSSDASVSSAFRDDSAQLGVCSA